MNPTRFTRQGIPVYEPLTASDVDPWSPEEALKATMPLMDSPAKTDYLGYRACGFGVREAAALIGHGQKTISRWRREDPQFALWEGERLPELQSTVGDTLLKHQFMRNMHLVLKIDGDSLRTVAFTRDKESIPASTMEWAKDAAKRYKSQDLTLMLKALSGDVGDGGSTINLNVQINNENITAVEAERAAIRKVLSQFTVNTQLIEGQLSDTDSDT